MIVLEVAPSHLFDWKPRSETPSGVAPGRAFFFRNIALRGWKNAPGQTASGEGEGRIAQGLWQEGTITLLGLRYASYRYRAAGQA